MKVGSQAGNEKIADSPLYQWVACPSIPVNVLMTGNPLFFDKKSQAGLTLRPVALWHLHKLVKHLIIYLSIQ